MCPRTDAFKGTFSYGTHTPNQASLAGDGHPIVGDYKYGNAAQNDSFKAKYHLKHQLLHAYELHMPKLSGALSEGVREENYAPLPKKFEQILEEGFSWQHGTPED